MFQNAKILYSFLCFQSRPSLLFHFILSVHLPLALPSFPLVPQLLEAHSLCNVYNSGVAPKICRTVRHCYNLLGVLTKCRFWLDGTGIFTS